VTHAELVALAARWLRTRRRLSLVLADFRTVSTSEQPDAIGWTASGWSVLVECKASRADFLRDAKKFARRRPDAMGQERYYLCPPGMIVEDDLPEAWGLLHARRLGANARARLADVQLVRAAAREVWHRERMREELPLVLSALRRALKTGGSLAYEREEVTP
jgi:hypothetical protein